MTEKPQKAKILIVEDESINAKLLESRVRKFGYIPVGPVPTGEAAIELALREKPDLVLMDIKLQGDMDGIDAATIIKENIQTQIIYITAHSEEEFLERAKPTIPQGYILKPFQDKELKIMIEMALYISKVDAERRKSETNFQSMIESMIEPTYIGNQNYKIEYMNPAMTKMAGKNDGPCYKVIHGLDKKCDWCVLPEVIAGKNARYEIVSPKDGRTYTVSNSPIFNQDGSVSKLTIFRDTSERKQVEIALRESEEKYRQLFNHAPAAIYDIDFAKNMIISANDVACNVTGYSREEILRMSPLDLLTEDSRSLFLSRLDAIKKGDNVSDTVEYEVITKSDGRKWALLSINFDYQDNKVVGASVVAHDITEKKITEYKLQKFQEKAESYRNDLEFYSKMTPLGIIIFDNEFNITSWNPSAEKIFGFTAKEAIGKNTFDLLVPEYHHDNVKKVLLIDDPKVTININDNKTKDGRIITVQWFNSPRFDKDGKLAGLIAACQDITDKIRTEKALEESEALLNATGMMANVGGWELDAETLELTWTEQTYRIHEVPLDYKPPLEEAMNFFHPDDRKKLSDAINLALEQGAPYDMEVRFITAKGNKRWTRTKCIPELVDGKVVKLKGIFQDITARKHAEEALSWSEKDLKESQRIARLGSWRLDVATNQVVWSEELYKMYGFDPNLPPPPYTEHMKLFTPESWERLSTSLANTVDTGIPYELELETVRDDGSNGWMWVRGEAVLDSDGQTVALWGAAQDITDRKQAEERIRYIERRNQALLDYSPVCHKIVDLDFNLQYMSANSFKMLKLEPDADVYGKPYPFYFFPESFKNEMKTNMKKVKDTGKPITMEALTNDIEGNKVWLDSTLIPVFDNNNKIEYLTVVSADTTSRKDADESLRKSEKQFRHFFEHLTIGVAVYEAVEDGKDFVFYDMNPTGQKLSKVSIDDIRGKRLTEVFPGVQDLGLFKALQSTWRTGQPSHVPFGKYADERITQWVENRIFRLPSGRIVAVYDDRTEVIRLEEELRQAQKMEAIGTLAGGIAHDFNNLLQAINGYTQLLMMDKPEEDPEYKNLKEIHKSSNRASELVRQLLLFSRKGDVVRKPVKLNHEVENARRMLERTIPKMVNIEFHPGGRLWDIMADNVQIEQILLNLGTNAADAMPEGGRLVIETENIKIDNEYLQNHLGAQPGNYVLLTITDTGEGIDDETKEKIFEPFFTTKEFGKGTGLGLASVYGIVKAHGGYIMCYSEVGMGTTFKIYLPAIEELKAEPEKRISDKRPKGGTETILLVDDEISIRGFASQALMKFGYTPLTASSGEEALEVYSKRRDEIDLVVIDLGMPGMGGHKCVQELLKINPDIKIIIASGYSINGQVKDTLEAGAKGFVGKPYQIYELLGKVREVLDGEE